MHAVLYIWTAGELTGPLASGYGAYCHSKEPRPVSLSPSGFELTFPHNVDFVLTPLKCI